MIAYRLGTNILYISIYSDYALTKAIEN